MKKIIKKILMIMAFIYKKVFSLFVGKKKILIYSHFVTMDAHIMKYYESIKDEGYDVKFVFFDYSKIDKTRYKNYGIDKKMVITSLFKYVISIPKLIVVADLNFMYEYMFFSKTLQLGHGGGPTVYDGETTKKAYIYGTRSTKKDGTPKYDAYLEANKYVIPLIEQENRKFTGRIFFSSNKYLDEYKEKVDMKQVYKDELNIAPDKKVIFFIGSWNENSLFHTLGKEVFKEIKRLSANKEYQIVTSIHPREYINYDESVEPYGKYIDELESYGVIVKKVGTDMIPYIVSSDLIFCDYSSVMEECILCGKNIILSDFNCDKLYEYSIGVRLKNKIPVIKDAKDLEQYFKMDYSEKYKKELDKIIKEIDSPIGFYKECCIKTTQKLLEQ